MDRRELNRQGVIFKKHLSTFRETSKAKIQDGESEGTYCLGEDVCLEAVDFDAVQRKWYEIRRANGEKCPCSVDAVYFSDARVFAVEFKSGTNVSGVNLVRKIYDTAIGFIEHTENGLDYCRSRMEYVVVLKGGCDLPLAEKVSQRTAFYMSSPWNAHVWDRWKLYNLEGVIAAKTYVLPSELFARFAKEKHWTS